MARERDLRKILNFDTCVDEDTSIKHTYTCHIMIMPSVYKDRLASIHMYMSCTQICSKVHSLFVIQTKEVSHFPSSLWQKVKAVVVCSDLFIIPVFNILRILSGILHRISPVMVPSVFIYLQFTSTLMHWNLCQNLLTFPTLFTWVSFMTFFFPMYVSEVAFQHSK